MMYKSTKAILMSSLALMTFFVIGCGSSVNSTKSNSEQWLNLDTVKAGKFDTGKMWTFDFPPKEYFQSEYNFSPDDEWLNNVRMSALRFANYCSASFVSEDGLVMTNDHCARESVGKVTKEGENLSEDGFIANTLADERKVPGLYVSQLVEIKDVTAEVQAAIDAGKTDAEIAKNKQEKFSELTDLAVSEKGKDYTAQIVTFYNGGKYSLYSYRKYDDVRIVFSPEVQMGFFGGDPDNFTYPRYDLDCSFFRVYDETGTPLKTKNFFKWSPNGAAEGDPVFVVGNPGRTSRLSTTAVLEYSRDYAYPLTVDLLNGAVKVYEEVIAEHPDRLFELQDRLFGMANSQKVYIGVLKGLRNPVFMQKKKDFENKFKSAVMAKPELKAKYGELWDKIAGTRTEAKEYFKRNAAFNVGGRGLSTEYFQVARKLVNFAHQMKMPDAQRMLQYKDSVVEKAKAKLAPAKFDKVVADKFASVIIGVYVKLLGEDTEYAKILTGGKKGSEALQYAVNKSILSDVEKVNQLVEKGADAILSSDDPFIQYVVKTENQLEEVQAKSKEINEREANYIQLLGRALFEVYGTSIPPDATFTLRLADGVVKSYEYNGTKAPVKTTFYGLYDRYYSFKKQSPWNLPKRWENPPAEFDLETPMNFISTNDIIGGNSGSPLINKNAEIVGLAFDGNIESLPGNFIFDDTANRTVSVHSAGMLEALQDMYKMKRLSEELKTGKIVK
ncbi:MAG: peptidase S46 [Ignavibacteria bacterium CG_4_8_14_3_um_filter_37_9]|nr:MAG: peptidase S46 [Ignavibacteria bacterium CG_4_8_14_3_um_filter_37_9]